MTALIRKFHKRKSSYADHNEVKKESKKNWFSSIFVLFFFLLCGLFYLATIKGVPGNPTAKEMSKLQTATQPFELSPERGRYAHTVALAENGSFSLTKELADVVYPDVGYVDGRFYSFFAPGISIMVVPFYELGRLFNLAQVATYSVISLFALGTMIVLYRIGKELFKLSTAASLLPALLFGFGSTSWSYATTLYQHHLTTFFILSSFYAVYRFGKKGRFSFLWGAYVWFCYAAAFTVDYPNLLFMSPVMIYFFLTAFSFTKLKDRLTISFRPAFILTSICFILLTFLHGYYNYTQLGDWKRLSGNIVGYKTLKEKQLTFQAKDKAAVADLQSAKGTSNFFREEKLPNGFYTLTVAPDKGIFFFSPLFLLGISAIISLSKRIDQHKAILLSLAGINLFLYSSFGDPWGGWAFGPRYLTLSMAVLSLFIALWLSERRHMIISKFILFVLFAYSSAISLLGVLTTNAVPPKIEADYLKMKYGFFMNWDYFVDGMSSSFIYNTYVSQVMTLQQYFILLYTILLMLFFAVVFLIPRKIAYEH